MSYITALLALIPVFAKIINLFIKTPDEKRQEFLAKLPDKLREITEANDEAASKKDPSAINRVINGD